MTQQQVPGVGADPSNGMGDALARLTESELDSTERRRALGQLAAAIRRRGFKDVFRPKAAMAWIADTVVEIAPRIPVRDLPTLRAHFPGLNDMEIATRLARNAARTSAAIGAIGGG